MSSFKVPPQNTIDTATRRDGPWEYCGAGCAVVNNVLLGVFIVLFIGAWIDSSQNTRRTVVYFTLAVELCVEMLHVELSLVYLYPCERFYFWQYFGHIGWMLHLLLIIYKLYLQA